MVKLKTRFQTRLTTALTASALSVVVESLTGVPTAPFRIIASPGTAKEELMMVTAVTTATKTLAVLRAQQGTTAVKHAKGTLVYHSGLIAGDDTVLVTSKDDNATLTALEAGIILVTVDAKTMTLPAVASSYGVRYIIIATGAHTSGVVVDGDGAELVGGAATKTSPAKDASLDIYCDGSEWRVLGSHETWT